MFPGSLAKFVGKLRFVKFAHRMKSSHVKHIQALEAKGFSRDKIIYCASGCASTKIRAANLGGDEKETCWSVGRFRQKRGLGVA